MHATLEIDTHDSGLGFALFGANATIGAGTSVELPGDAKLTCQSLYIRKALGAPETLTLVVSFGSGVAAGLVADWLYEKLRGRATSLRIDRVEIQIEAGEIRRLLVEKIEKKE